MPDIDIAYEAERSLKRIRPRMLARIAVSQRPDHDTGELIATIDQRLRDHWPRLFALLHDLYGAYYDFYYYLENILLTAVACWLERPAGLYALDLRRENNPDWYLSERMAGAALYVDLFSGDLQTLRQRIPYFRETGITYLHLMPLFAARPGNSDGGYAVSDYRTVHPRLGRMEDLRALADELRRAGISLVLDYVFNHTSDDHEWALRAQEGEREYLDYYHIYPDRRVPDAYERHLREIFPAIRRGNFTWHPGMKKWVWTTFHDFQWDLKYANPEVFRAMAAEMLFLANTGVEILRLDAVAFIWKQQGTSCENLPRAHRLIQAFNTLCRIAAPGLVFKSEAIVHPGEVIKYIRRDECQLSYNPTLMALLWESIATRETRLLIQSLSHRQTIPSGTSWVNYLRSHDDIGWAFDDGDALAAGIDPRNHRDFLNRFYTGRFPGSFASGLPFQHNEDTGDMRISGTMASLAGLEQALDQRDPLLIDMAIRRIRMLYGILTSIGGIPLLFLGEEWGVLNDYTYQRDPAKAEDSRWVHRPDMKAPGFMQVYRESEAGQRIHRDVVELLRRRRENRALGGNEMRLISIDNPHVLAYLRWREANTTIVIANFSEQPQTIPLAPLGREGLARFFRDVFTNRLVATRDIATLEPYALWWLVED